MEVTAIDVKSHHVASVCIVSKGSADIAARIEAALARHGVSPVMGLNGDGIRDVNVLSGVVRSVNCLVVLFSSGQSRDDILLGTARIAKSAGRLVPVLVDDAELPSDLSDVHFSRLSTTARGDDDEFVRVLRSIATVSGLTLHPPPLTFEEENRMRRGRYDSPQAIEVEGNKYFNYGAATTGVWLAAEARKRAQQAEESKQ